MRRIDIVATMVCITGLLIILRLVAVYNIEAENREYSCIIKDISADLILDKRHINTATTSDELVAYKAIYDNRKLAAIGILDGATKKYVIEQYNIAYKLKYNLSIYQAKQSNIESIRSVISTD